MAKFYPAWSSYRCTGGTVIAAEVATKKGALRFACMIHDRDSRDMTARDIERMQHQLRKAWEVDQ